MTPGLTAAEAAVAMKKLTAQVQLTLQASDRSLQALSALVAYLSPKLDPLMLGMEPVE